MRCVFHHVWCLPSLKVSYIPSSLKRIYFSPSASNLKNINLIVLDCYQCRPSVTFRPFCRWKTHTCYPLECIRGYREHCASIEPREVKQGQKGPLTRPCNGLYQVQDKTQYSIPKNTTHSHTHTHICAVFYSYLYPGKD